jgi:hypothetical protein
MSIISKLILTTADEALPAHFINVKWRVSDKVTVSLGCGE